jgi:hypothetical protein
MAVKKKRTGLDALGLGAEKSASVEVFEEKQPVRELPAVETASKTGSKAKRDIQPTTAYLPKAVHEQLRELAFTERKKMHDYLLEGLDRVFQNRGLKSIKDLTGE